VTPAEADAKAARGAAVLDSRGPAGRRETRKAQIRQRLARCDMPLVERQYEVVKLIDADMPWLLRYVELLEGVAMAARKADPSNRWDSWKRLDTALRFLDEAEP
jgi:hypothetical protein